jgi:hypothetical protein
MVEQVRYYYSKDGTVTEGPVSRTDLGRLFLDQVINSESFIRREDEETWQPLDPRMFQPRPRLTPTLRGRRRPEPTPSSGFSRPEPRPQRRTAWYSDAYLLDPRLLRVLTTICIVTTLSGAFLAIHLRYVVFKETLRTTDPVTLGEVLGYFALSAGIIFLVPYLFSLFFRYPLRRPVLVLGTLCAAPLFVWIEYDLFSGDLTQHAHFARENGPEISGSNLPWQIEPNGCVDFSPALRSLQEMREAASIDTTDLAVVRRHLAVVINGLILRLQACDIAAQACPPFNPLTLGSLDDINSRISRLSTLRNVQADLDGYLQALAANCRKAISNDGLGSDTIDEAVTEFSQSARTDLLSTLSGITLKISDDETACLKFLAQNWGHWHIDNDAVVLDDPTALATYNTSWQTVQGDLQSLRDLGKQ